MKLKFNYNVPDKHTGEVYEEGKTYTFTEERGNEIKAVINRDTGLPFATEVKEEKKETKNKGKKAKEDKKEKVDNEENTANDNENEDNKEKIDNEKENNED